jgi:hypothetical protein
MQFGKELSLVGMPNFLPTGKIKQNNKKFKILMLNSIVCSMVSPSPN